LVECDYCRLKAELQTIFVGERMKGMKGIVISAFFALALALIGRPIASNPPGAQRGPQFVLAVVER